MSTGFGLPAVAEPNQASGCINHHKSPEWANEVCHHEAATALGLHAHFMGGFDAQRARTEFNVPEDFDIGAAFAIGYVDEGRALPGPRTRKGIEEIVFSGDWGRPAPELR